MAPISQFFNDAVKELEIKKKSKLKDLEPNFKTKIVELIIDAKKYGLDVDIFSGYRSYADQTILYDKRVNGRRVTNARAGESWHNFGLAADIVFKKNGQWTWSESMEWAKLGKIGKSLGLEWGGDWRKIVDRPHFQFTNGLKISQARDLYDNGGLLAVWDGINKQNLFA